MDDLKGREICHTAIVGAVLSTDEIGQYACKASQKEEGSTPHHPRCCC